MKYKKYEDFSQVHQHQTVRMVTTDFEWNNHMGIIERVNYDKDNKDSNIAIVFCMEKPDCRYLVFESNLESIIMVK